MKKRLTAFVSILIAIIFVCLAGGCGDDDDDSSSSDDDSGVEGDDSGATDDAGDDTQADDDSGADDTAGDDSADDDTSSTLCDEAVAHAFECDWVIPGADTPMEQADAAADCVSHTVHDADTWACMLNCIAGLEADCSNAKIDAACLSICVFHDGHVPDPDTCTPMFPDFKACGHRGETPFAPANTIPSYEAAIAHGAKVIEVDVRTTSDGYLVCSHDSDVSIWTNGSGNIEDKTLAEVQALIVDDSDWGDQYPDLHIPTFEEALAAIKGNAMVDIDAKSAPKDKIIQAVNDAGMHDEVIAYCSSTGEADEYVALDPTFPIMPAVYTLAEATYALTTYSPDYIELETLDTDVIAAVHAAGATAFLDALGVQDLMALLGTFEPWYEMLDDGIDVIQTDLTTMLVDFIDTLCE
jgi:hypothetical protein